LAAFLAAFWIVFLTLEKNASAEVLNNERANMVTRGNRIFFMSLSFSEDRYTKSGKSRPMLKWSYGI
jgi:hypothetical protein